jgi:hypothetical protein
MVTTQRIFRMVNQKMKSVIVKYNKLLTEDSFCWNACVKNGLKWRQALSLSPFHFALGYANRKVQENRKTGTESDTSASGQFWCC